MKIQEGQNRQIKSGNQENLKDLGNEDSKNTRIKTKDKRGLIEPEWLTIGPAEKTYR